MAELAKIQWLNNQKVWMLAFIPQVTGRVTLRSALCSPRLFFLIGKYDDLRISSSTALAFSVLCTRLHSALSAP